MDGSDSRRRFSPTASRDAETRLVSLDDGRPTRVLLVGGGGHWGHKWSQSGRKWSAARGGARGRQERVQARSDRLSGGLWPLRKLGARNRQFSLEAAGPPLPLRCAEPA